MRFLGVVLVAAGAVLLGYQGVTHVSPDQPGGVVRLAADRDATVWLQPLVGAAALVAGLAALAAAGGGRRDD